MQSSSCKCSRSFSARRASRDTPEHGARLHEREYLSSVGRSAETSHNNRGQGARWQDVPTVAGAHVIKGTTGN